MTVDGARPAPTPPERPSPLASAGLRLSDWFERWFPDAFSLALAAAVLVYCMLQFLVHVPPVLFLVWALNFTLPYIPPVLP